MKIENHLDIAFNLNDGTERPYQKPDNIIQFTHVETNHPPKIIRQIPKTIKNTSPISPLKKKYSVNQHLSMKINYTRLVTPTKIKVQLC